MSANAAFALVLTLLGLSFWAYNAHMNDGWPAFRAALLGMFYGASFVLGLAALHALMHCVFETCGESFWYRLFVERFLQ